jgi:hypothetical protein
MAITLPAGTSLGGKYRIERLLGEGGVGSVYAAEQMQTGKRVALKCVDISTAPDPAAAERLIREAQAAARVRHPNVLDIYDVGRTGQTMFLVMEYLEGEPLAAALARGRMPVQKLISLLLPAMRGVAEAHRKGVVHRDIKPENIFLARNVDSREPTAMVLDFGISKLLDPRGHTLRSLTADGCVIGTPYYMSYEQALGEKGIDGRADVYAFGVILYEGLTGKHPRTADDFASLVKLFLSKQVPAPIELNPDIPRALSALVMWAIERDRERRISSMESLIRELEPFAAERPKVSAAVQRGRTLVGPWGMGPAKAAQPPTAALRKKTQLAATADVVLWLKRKRSSQLRRTILLAGLALVALGLIAFSLVPREELASQVRPRPAVVASAPAEPLPPPVPPPASAAPAVTPPPAPVRELQTDVSAAAVEPPKAPAVQPAPKRPSTPTKASPKERNYGIY